MQSRDSHSLSGPSKHAKRRAAMTEASVASLSTFNLIFCTYSKNLAKKVPENHHHHTSLHHGSTFRFFFHGPHKIGLRKKNLKESGKRLPWWRLVLRWRNKFFLHRPVPRGLWENQLKGLGKRLLWRYPFTAALSPSLPGSFVDPSLRNPFLICISSFSNQGFPYTC